MLKKIWIRLRKWTISLEQCETTYFHGIIMIIIGTGRSTKFKQRKHLKLMIIWGYSLSSLRSLNRWLSYLELVVDVQWTTTDTVNNLKSLWKMVFPMYSEPKTKNWFHHQEHSMHPTGLTTSGWRVGGYFWKFWTEYE